MSWPGALLALACTYALLLLPGAALAWTLRLRGTALAAAALPLSATSAGFGGILFSSMKLGWGWWQYAGFTLLLCLLAWAVLSRIKETPSAMGLRTSPAKTILTPAAFLPLVFLLAAALITISFVKIVQTPDALAQAHDTIFHAPAIEFIARTGEASSLTLGQLAPQEQPSFYPSAWHDLAALVRNIPGVSTPEAINLTNLVIVTTAWPLSCLWLSRALFGASTMIGACALLASASMPLFPFLPLQFGVIYPFMMGIAMMGTFLGFLVVLLTRQASICHRVPAGGFLLLGLPGLGLIHPGIINAISLFITPLMVGLCLRALRSHKFASLGVMGLWFLFLSLLWIFSRPGRGAGVNWENQGDAGRALTEVPLSLFLGYDFSLVPHVLFLVGLVLLWSGRAALPARWFLFSLLLGFAAYVIGSWRSGGELRWAATGVWYNDYFRIASMIPVLVVPLMGLGMAWVARRVPSLFPRARRRLATAVLFGVVLLGLLPLNPGLNQAIKEGREKYSLSNESRLLTLDEMTLMRRLPDLIPPGSVLIGDPLTGAGLAYVYGGMEMVQPTNSLAPTPEGRLLMSKLDTAQDDPSVCEAAEKLNVKYVLDFGHNSVHGNQLSYRQGFLNLQASHGFQLVEQRGSARLLRLAACD